MFLRASDLYLLAIELLLFAFVKLWKREAAPLVMTDERSVANRRKAELAIYPATFQMA